MAKNKAPEAEPVKAKKSKAAPVVETPAKKVKKDKTPPPAPAKAAKAGKAKKSKATDEFAVPSEVDSGGGDSWVWTKEAVDELCLVYPKASKDVDDKFHPGQMQEIIVADIVVLNEKKPEKSERHNDVWVFQGWLKGALRASIGKAKVLGRLEQGKTADRGNFPWLLSDPTEADKDVARAYLASVDPLA